MARFITTIELHGADEKDYTTLHTELKKASFIVVKSHPAKEKTSRREEFNREGHNVTLQEVTDAVLRATGKIGRKYSFTIIRSKPVYN